MDQLDRAFDLILKGYTAEEADARATLEAEGGVLYPEVKAVRLVGEDGNAFAIMARVTNAMRKAKLDQKVIDDYVQEAMSGDYNNLLYTTMTYVRVAPPMVCSVCEMSECECDDIHEGGF
jgi:hypothetical protein